MGLRGLLAELRHRGVLKVFSTLVTFGFPIACLMAWGCEFSSQGVHPAQHAGAEAPRPRGSDVFFEQVRKLPKLEEASRNSTKTTE